MVLKRRKLVIGICKDESDCNIMTDGFTQKKESLSTLSALVNDFQGALSVLFLMLATYITFTAAACDVVSLLV